MNFFRYFKGAMVLSAISLLATSCSLVGDDSSDIEMLAVQIESDGHWSMYKPDGTIVYKDEFKNTPSAVVNGLFSVKEGEGYTIYRVGEKAEALKDCDGLKEVGVYRDGLMPVVYPKSRITLIDNKGNKKHVLEPVKGKEIVASDNSYYDGLLLVENEDDKYGFVDTNGKVAIDIKYGSAHRFSEGLAVVAVESGDSTQSKLRHRVINKKGETVFDINKDYELESYYYQDGKLVVKDANDRYLVLDKKGESTKLSSKCKNVGMVVGKYVTYRNDDGEWGVMDFEGEIVVRAKYESVYIIDENTFLANKEKEAVVLNAKGDVKKTIADYERVNYFEPFGFIGIDKSTFTFLDDKGKPKNKESEFANVFGGECHEWRISSDYFDVKAMAAQMAEMVGTDGIGKYKFGAAPSAYFNNPEDYTYTSSVNLDELGKTGYKYRIKVEAYFSSKMADYSYSFDAYYNYHTNYFWNPDSKLMSFIIEAEADRQIDIDGAKEVTSAFKNKGFKVVKESKKNENTYGALLEKGNVCVCVLGGEVSYKANAVVFLKSNTQILNEAKKKIASYDDEEYEVPEVEEVVADSVVVDDYVE